MSSQNTTDGGRGYPDDPEVAAAVRKLSVGPVDIAPRLEQRKDLRDFLGPQTMHRAARLAVIQTATVAPASPPPRPPLIQLQVATDAAVLPPIGDGAVD
jgi:hypothetical protein